MAALLLGGTPQHASVGALLRGEGRCRNVNQQVLVHVLIRKQQLAQHLIAQHLRWSRIAEIHKYLAGHIGQKMCKLCWHFPIKYYLHILG